ncbi:TIGR01457 family HAD-type hydrolase [Ureibacillus composti]
MKNYKAYCFDLDGTVYRGKEGIETAVKFIQDLQKSNLEYYFVTNNSSKTPAQLQEALRNIGLIVEEERIYSSSLATAKYVANQYPEAKIHTIGSDGLRFALKSVGFNHIEDDNPDVVVMGIDRMIDYQKLSKACLAVQRGAKLIGTNEDVKFPDERGFVPGNGSFVRLVANVAAVDPIFIGKPSPVMLEVIQKEHGLDQKEMVMIGDNYDTDILCGIRFGCDTIHVNTGVTNTEMVKQKDKQPTYCIENLDYFNI